MGHPHRLGDEESVDLTGLSDQRPAVRGEREDAVEAALDLRLREFGQQSLRRLPLGGEVVRSELEARGHPFAGDLVGRVGLQRVEVDGHRPVRVGADADPLAPFAVVQILVLVAQDRSLCPGGQLILPDE